MEVKELLVRYLGFSLISNILKAKECEEIIRKIIAIIQSWTAKILSYASRV